MSVRVEVKRGRKIVSTTQISPHEQRPGIRRPGGSRPDLWREADRFFSKPAHEDQDAAPAPRF